MTVARAVTALVAAMALGAAAFAGASSSPARAAGSAHPRIFLDAATLSTLRDRANAGSPEWTALKARCDEYLHGTVEWPDGNDYPNDGSIGEGYQGSGYFGPLLNVGLCHQVALTLDPTAAAAYGAKGATILVRMSAPPGDPHSQDPLRDSGYGIRFYGLGMAIGFDWLYDALTPSRRTRVVAAINRWIGAFETGGFERDFPQGNYFAGYYAAKGIGALATEDDNPQAAAMWSDWLNRVHGGLVRPYYAQNLRGGGWPEGWNYGPLASLNMSWPVLAAQTAKGIDLLPRYQYPLNNPRFLLYFTWPSLLTMEDADAQYDGDNPSATHSYLVTQEAGLLERWGSSFAPYFHSFARAVRSVQPAGEEGPDWDLWQNFLFWDDSAPELDYRTLVRSYYARGIEMGAVRSTWATSAVWAAFKAGPYVNNPDNGEEYFDKGSLAIVNGSKQFLVNATGALLRNTPGTNDGSAYYNPIYDDLFGDGGKRDLFNVFYVDEPTPPGQGNYLRRDGARTSMTRFEDHGTYVAMRASHLEDEYPRDSGASKTMSSWTREVVYLRPSTFVVVDRTALTSASLDQWLAWHVAKQPVADGPAGRFDVGSGSQFAGTVQAVLPAGHVESIVDLFGGHKIYRLEVRPGTPATSERWLTVFDAARSRAAAAVASPLSGASANIVGALLTRPAGNAVVAAGSADTIVGDVHYEIPDVPTRHVITDLAPSTSYSIQTSVAGGVRSVTVTPGPGVQSSASGVLAFVT